MIELTPSQKIQMAPKHILVVEDNIHLRFTLAAWLRLHDYVVYEASSADEAMAILKSPLTLDIVITDTQMPGEMDGIDLARHINQNFHGLKVIVVSGLDLHKQLKEEGILFFRKPYDLYVISNHISKLLNPVTDEGDV